MGLHEAEKELTVDRIYNVELKGLSPLIMHWDNIDWADQVSEKRTEIKENDKANFAAGDDRCPTDTWKGYIYNDGQLIGLPTDNLQACLVKAGAKVTLQRQETFKKAMASGILFTDLYASFANNGKPIKYDDYMGVDGKFSEHATKVKKLGFELLVKRAAVGAAKHVRVRPMFRNWSATAQLTVVDDRITDEVLKKVWEYAGLMVGIGDWRPDSPKKPGPYGRFAVTLNKAR